MKADHKRKSQKQREAEFIISTKRFFKYFATMDAIDEEFLPPSINRTDNISVTDIDLTMDGSVVGAYDNFSYLYCAVNNFTYINVTCEATFEYSLVLLGKLYLISSIVS